MTVTNNMYAMGTAMPVIPSNATLAEQLTFELQAKPTFAMERPLVEQWIARLRSGEYLAYTPQYTTAPMYLAQIRRDHPDHLGTDVRVWSTLGVLGDIVCPWRYALTSATSTILSMESSVSTYLPINVQNLIGLQTSHSIQLNKLQSHGATFDDIADWISLRMLPLAREAA